MNDVWQVVRERGWSCKHHTLGSIALCSGHGSPSPATLILFLEERAVFWFWNSLLVEVLPGGMPPWSGGGSFKLISDDAYRGAPAWEEISEQGHKPGLQRANSPFFLKLPSDVSPQAFPQLIVVYEPRIYILNLTKGFFFLSCDYFYISLARL